MAGWGGAKFEGDFPTLGHVVGHWIEKYVVIPDGYLKGQPYRLTDEMWRFLLHFYRLYPHAAPWPAPDGLLYTGAQLRRSQKWGKDPFGAAIILAEALGPTRFDGWATDDRDDPRNFRPGHDGEGQWVRIRPGDPIGSPYPTPLIVCLATSEDQVANTWRPLLSMVRNGPLAELPGIDVGETRIKLPGGGDIEPVSTSATARLGAPLTMLTLTETHLFTLQGGYRKVAGAVKRNVAGMDGRWLEMTNAWDPTEGSEAQVTAESGDERVLVDAIESRRVDNLDDEEKLYAELLRQYGDSSRERGGWVNLKGRIMHEARSKRHMEADRRRFFLNEIVTGLNNLVDPTAWDLLYARPDAKLTPGDQICLGFDGSKYNDATALVACRVSDGHLFQIRIWERPPHADREWRVPSAEVDQVVGAVFEAYRVGYMYCDPWRWQDYLDRWAARWPKRIVEFATNIEQRMDRAIERFFTASTSGAILHDASDDLTAHMKGAVLVKGSRKKPRPGSEDLSSHYMKLAKRTDKSLIDGAVAAVLAYEARGQAVEDDVFADDMVNLSGRLFGTE